MTDKKDGPGPKDGPAKAGDRGAPEAGAAKRPFATIDLKAVEVPASGQRAGPAAPKAADPVDPKAPPAAMPRGEADTARKVATAAAEVGAARAPASGPSAARPASGAAAQPGASKPAPAASPESVARPAAASSPSPAVPAGKGSFFSHVAAGLVGAAIAVAAAPIITPAIAPLLQEMGLASPPPVSPEVTRRLAALESKASQPPLPPVDPAKDPARLAAAAAEAGSKRIDALQQQVAAVGEAQSKALRIATDLEQRLAKEPPIADVGQRLVGLEQQLRDLSRAAREEPDRAGRIPQLIQMTSRIADLEAALGLRIGEVRKEATREIDTRLAPVAEATEAVRAATQRLDRDLGTLKGETNRLATGLDDVKTGTERLQLALKAARDETAGLGASLDGVRRDMETRLKAAAKPDDVSAAIAPLASQVSALERNLTTVVKSEGERNATAERIVLSLELGNLKRAMERGAPYGRELAEVAKVSGPRIDLGPLQRYRDEGVPTLGELSRAFRPIAHAVLDADAEKADGSVVDRLLSGAKTFVRVRKTTHATGDQSPEAAVARIEDALKAGRLADVLAEMKGIQRQPAAAKDWIAKVEARQSVDAALKAIDEQLKASLGGGSAAAAAPAAQKKGQP